MTTVTIHWSLVFVLLYASGLSFSSEVLFLSGNCNHLLTDSVVFLNAVLLHLSSFPFFYCLLVVFQLTWCLTAAITQSCQSGNTDPLFGDILLHNAYHL